MHTNTIGQLLLDISAVGFTATPIRFKSGILSPVYVDNRTLPSFPEQWIEVIETFGSLIREKALAFDGIAGIESAGIPHSAALGYSLRKPSVFVRKAAKDHGTKRMVEGGDVKGKQIVLVEDLVTTGGSSLHGVEQLRAAGAQVTDCLCIVSYGFAQADEAFKKAGVVLHPLVTFSEILSSALQAGLIDDSQHREVDAWLADPHAWTKAHETP